MDSSITRRHALKAGIGGSALASLGDLAFLARLNPVSAAEATLEPNILRLQPEIEPLVRFIEETPREKLLEETAQRIKRGLSYRDLLAALLLAGVKNIEPRPSVGFKFHAVLVVNSAHLASMASPPEHRWLPIFWALDYFKSAAARDVEERGDWVMSAVDESSLPPAHNARAAFQTAMDDWGTAAADSAVAALARTAGAHEIFELFFRYGMRDFRSIGHKAIYVANSFRTLNCIGWQHAEPVLRSLAYALLSHEGDNPAKRDDEADRPFRRNQELASSIKDNWQDGKVDKAATANLLQTLRSASNVESCDAVVELLASGIAPQSIWDALHVCAGEMLMQQPGIVPLHAVTTTNALHFAYQASGDDNARRLLLLQNAAFLPMFRKSMGERGRVKKISIDDLQSADGSKSENSADAILATLSKDPMAAAQRLFASLRDSPQQAEAARTFMDDARLLVFFKGDDAHDYKFSSAVLEDFYHISPAWRNVYLSSNIFNLPGTGAPDNKLINRARAALNA